MGFEPYYETDLGVLYRGDCLEIMPLLEPVDLVVTDPPYGTKTNQRPGEWMVGEFSNIMPLVLPKIYYALKNDGAFYCFTSWTMLSEWLLRYQQYFKLQNIIIWDKERHSGCYSPNSWQFTWEGIFFGIKGSRKIREYQRDLIKSTEKGRRIAMQKPVDIIEKLIKASSDIDMFVLDPFIGSGSTAIACERLNRRWIGVEISEEYCEISAKRIDNERKQLKLFG